MHSSILGATGAVQGIGNFKQAEGIAEATAIRNHDLKLLDEEFKAKDLNKDITIEVEAVDEPCTSSVNDDIVSEVEEDALSAKQNKMQDQTKEAKEVWINTELQIFICFCSLSDPHIPWFLFSCTYPPQLNIGTCILADSFDLVDLLYVYFDV